MPRIFRIHGDNIVECERIAKLILEETDPTSVDISLMSPSTIVYNIRFNYLGRHFEWQLELLPGFNKAGRTRWEANIFAGLKDSGSFLDETPDAIVTYIENGLETILYAKTPSYQGIRVQRTARSNPQLRGFQVRVVESNPNPRYNMVTKLRGRCRR